MAGYNGYSKSNNAVEAENDGRYPLTIAVTVLAEKAEITQKKAKAILTQLGTHEYHHSSKFYNTVNYYDVAAAARIVNLAKTLGLDIDKSFIKAAIANGLETEDDPMDKLTNPDEYGTSVVEFIESVKTGEWL